MALVSARLRLLAKETGEKGLRFKEGDGIKDSRGIVEGIEDKVTQDVDLSEVSGSLTLACARPSSRAPGLGRRWRLQLDTSLRRPLPLHINSGSSRVTRWNGLKVVENMRLPQPATGMKLDMGVKEGLLRQVGRSTGHDHAADAQMESAVYGAILGAFIQGLEVGFALQEPTVLSVS